MTDVERIAKGLTKVQRKALLRTSDSHLLTSQSDRGALVGALTDYSFRPAAITPLGLAVRAHLQENPDAA